MKEAKNSGQPENAVDDTAARNRQTGNDATSTETLSDIEKKEVVAQADSNAQGEDNRSTTEATPDGQLDSASDDKSTRGKDDSGPM